MSGRLYFTQTRGGGGGAYRLHAGCVARRGMSKIDHSANSSGSMTPVLRKVCYNVTGYMKNEGENDKILGGDLIQFLIIKF